MTVKVLLRWEYCLTLVFISGSLYWLFKTQCMMPPALTNVVSWPSWSSGHQRNHISQASSSIRIHFLFTAVSGIENSLCTCVSAGRHGWPFNFEWSCCCVCIVSGASKGSEDFPLLRVSPLAGPLAGPLVEPLAGCWQLEPRSPLPPPANSTSTCLVDYFYVKCQ